MLNHSLTRPRFDEAVFRRRQIQSITGLQQQETTPDYTATRELTKLIYPNHPYGSGANITVDSLKQVSLDDIRAFHRTHYGKDNAIVAIVGDLNRKQAEQLVERVLKDLPAKATATHAIPPVPKQTAQRRDIPFAGTQAQVLLGTSLIKRAYTAASPQRQKKARLPFPTPPKRKTPKPHWPTPKPSSNSLSPKARPKPN